MLKSFEDMVNVCLRSERPVHFLYFFMKVGDMPAETDSVGLFPEQDLTGIDSICTLLFDAHEQVKPDMTFEQLVQKGDIRRSDWDLVVVMTMRSSDKNPIPPAQGQEALAKVRAGIIAGDIPRGVPVFDRHGQAKMFDRVAPLGQVDEPLN